MSSLYILDTDHLTLLQRGDANVTTNMQRIPETQRATTVISLAEQLRGRLAKVHRATTESDAARAYSRLNETAAFFRRISIVPYDDAAIAVYKGLRSQRLRIGTQDLRIAAIALAQNATVVTRNQRDLGQVPALSIVDWSIPVS